MRLGSGIAATCFMLALALAPSAFADSPSLQVFPSDLWATQYNSSAGLFTAKVSNLSPSKAYDLNFFLPPCRGAQPCEPYYSGISNVAVSQASGACSYSAGIGAISCKGLKVFSSTIGISFQARNVSASGKAMQRQNESEQWALDINRVANSGAVDDVYPKQNFSVGVHSPVVGQPSYSQSGSSFYLWAQESFLYGSHSNPTSVEFFYRPASTLSPVPANWVPIGKGTENSNTWLAKWDASGVPSGSYDVNAYACASTAPESSCGASQLALIVISNFEASPPSDAIPPSFVSGPSATGITDSNATISWVASEDGNGLVLYGIGAAYGGIAQSAHYSATQSVFLSGLSAGTAYRFIARTCDANKNCRDSADNTFTTLARQGQVSQAQEEGPAPNAAPAIAGASASPATALSGSVVEFSVSATDPEGDPLSYSWDFRDGKRSNEQNPKHSFILASGVDEAAFDVIVTVSDGNLSSSRSVQVRVRKADLIILVTSPVSDFSAQNQKNSGVQVRLQLTDSQRQLVPNGKVKAFVGESEVELSEGPAGVFSGSFRASERTMGVEYLYADANASIGGREASARTASAIYFAPLPISAKLEFVPAQLYYGGRLEAVRLVPSLGGVFAASATIEASLGGSPLQFSEREGHYEAIVGRNAEELQGQKVIVSRLEDKYGNRLAPGASLEVNVAEESPEFRLIASSPAEGKEFGFTQEIPVSVKVGSNAMERLSEIQVRVVAGGKETALKESQGIYSGRVSFGLGADQSQKIIMVGSARLDGKGVAARKEIGIALSSQLRVSVLPVSSPSEMKASVLFPDNTPFTGNDLNAVLYDNNRAIPVTLSKAEGGEYYSALLPESLPLGEHVLRISVAGNEFYGESEAQAFNPKTPDWTAYAAIVGLAMIMGFMWLHFGKKEKAKSVRELDEEREAVKRLVKKAEYEYYKRRITEEQYKRLLMEYQQRSDALEVKIRAMANRETLKKLAEARPRPSHVESVKKSVLGKADLELKDARLVEIGKGARKESAREGEQRKAPKLIQIEEVIVPSLEAEPKREKWNELREKLLEKKEISFEGLSQGEISLVYRLVMTLEQARKKYSREQIMQSLLEEGVTKRIAEKTVEVLYSS